MSSVFRPKLWDHTFKMLRSCHDSQVSKYACKPIRRPMVFETSPRSFSPLTCTANNKAVTSVNVRAVSYPHLWHTNLWLALKSDLKISLKNLRQIQLDFITGWMKGCANGWMCCIDFLWGNSQESVFIACDESVLLWWLEWDISHSHLVFCSRIIFQLKNDVAEREIPYWLQYYSHKHARASQLLLI